MYRMTEWDYEGELFVNFPAEAWVSGAAQKAVEDTIREMDGEFAAITPGSVRLAISTIQHAQDKMLKPWQLEARRILWNPESVKRFPPYWRQNGGTHDEEDDSGWSFGGEENNDDGWGFDASPSGWDF